MNLIGKEQQSTLLVLTLTNKKEIKSVTITDSMLIEQRVMHDFSQIGKKDEFCICIRGKSFTEGNVIFTIKNFEGAEIYRIEFPSIQLINPDLSQGIEASIKDQENFIKKRVLEFFEEQNFITSAIKKDEIFDEDYSEKDIWEEIKNDKNAIGFYYLIGEEDGRKISFSKKRGKVVVCFNCC